MRRSHFGSVGSVSDEAWATPAAIASAKARLAGRMLGWQKPAAYGLLLVGEAGLGSDRVRFPVVNNPVHELPALVLGLVTGRRSETGTFELTPSELAGCIALLSPAAAATMYSHPNLESWRSIAHSWRQDPRARAFAVFVADLSDEVSSPYDAALRAQIAAGERSAPVLVGEV